MDILKIFSNKSSSKDVARDRLQFILIHDRADVSPEFLENIKVELLKVISNYAEIDTDEIEVRISKTEEIDGGSPALIASIPIKRMKNNL